MKRWLKVFGLLAVLVLLALTPVIQYLGGMIYLSLRDAIPKPAIASPRVGAYYEQNYNAFAAEVERKYPYVSVGRYYGWDNSYILSVTIKKGTITHARAMALGHAIQPEFAKVRSLTGDSGGTVNIWDASSTTVPVASVY